jgi:hypothetical protein
MSIARRLNNTHPLVISIKMKLPLLSICCLLVSLSLPSIAEEDNPSYHKQSQNRPSSLRLTSDIQHLSGIETLHVKPTTYQMEFTAQGKALNLQPILALRSRYLNTLTTHSSAMAKYKQTEQNINRQQDLFQHGISSKRSLQEQQAQWQSSKALVEAATFESNAIKDEANLLWGNALSNWIISKNSDALDGFLSHQQKLLQITLPTGKHLPDGLQTIYIDGTGDRRTAQKAQFISVATQTDNSAQGESYYFKTTHKKIIGGMQVTAWIPEQNSQASGVIIPTTALIWHMNQAFVYIKTTQEDFARVMIDNYSISAEGYFIPNALSADEELVIKGAQMLLSEELRGQIPSENDD